MARLDVDTQSSCNAHRRDVWCRTPEIAGQSLQVLHDGCEVKLVTRSRKAPQAHALETVVGLQVRKPHLDLFAFPTRLFVSLGPGQCAGDIARIFNLDRLRLRGLSEAKD